MDHETIKYINTKEDLYLIIESILENSKDSNHLDIQFQIICYQTTYYLKTLYSLNQRIWFNSYQLAEETEFSIVYGSKMTHELSARVLK